jgi:uncharacterized protein YjeT (DUF2065 family)
MNDFWTALCLVAVLEGLVLFAMPGGWKRTMAQLQEMSDQQLRTIGGVVLILGLVALYLVRGLTRGG